MEYNSVFYRIFFICFSLFLAGLIISMIDRQLIKKQLKQRNSEIYNEYFGRSLVSQSFKDAWREALFFIQTEWRGITCTDTVRHLRLHRYLEILTYINFFIAQVFILLAIATENV